LEAAICKWKRKSS